MNINYYIFVNYWNPYLDDCGFSGTIDLDLPENPTSEDVDIAVNEYIANYEMEMFKYTGVEETDPEAIRDYFEASEYSWHYTSDPEPISPAIF